MKQVRITIIGLFLFLAAPCVAQNVHKPTGYTYSGELFNDPDWGWSYKASPQDCALMKRMHEQIALALKKLEEEPGDYTFTKTDYTFAFDPKIQEESKAQGAKCLTCFYSLNPNMGDHFEYTYTLKFELIEESETYRKKAQVDDSLSRIASDLMMNRRAASNSDAREKELQAEMEQYRKEVERMDMSKLTEAQLKEIERKGTAIGNKANKNDKDQKIDNDSLHDMNGAGYAQVCNLRVRTNAQMYTDEKQLLLSLRNNPAFYFRELQIPGCDFACIYFDRFNKSEKLSYSNNPVFVAYIGRSYPNQAALPKPWVQPFCVRVTFSGNLKQIDELRNKIDFAKLRQIIQ